MARGFAQAPGASVEVLDAARPGLERSHIALLAQSRNRAVRETIASRDDVPLGVQAALAQDDAAEVRAAVAANAHTMRSVLDCLSLDKNRAVLVPCSAIRACTFEIVDRLAFHRKAEIRKLATAQTEPSGSRAIRGRRRRGGRDASRNCASARPTWRHSHSPVAPSESNAAPS